MVVLKCQACGHRESFHPEEGKELPKCPKDGTSMILDTDASASQISYGTAVYIHKYSSQK
jgi:hypothetical protein